MHQILVTRRMPSFDQRPLFKAFCREEIPVGSRILMMMRIVDEPF
jgi:hypothetical protein